MYERWSLTAAGVQVGDMLFAWERPVIVIDVARYRPPRPDGSLFRDPSEMLWVVYDAIDDRNWGDGLPLHFYYLSDFVAPTVILTSRPGAESV